MGRVFSSASKIVFIMLSITACVGFFIGILPMEQFMILSMSAFSYYFAKDKDKNTIV